MEIKAAEISSVIKDQIANFETKADVAEVGTVLSVGDGIARVYGLDNVQAGEMVEFSKGLKGMALNLAKKNFSLVLYDINKDKYELARFPINEKYGDLERFSFLINCWNRSRSSALSIASGDVPITGMPACSSLLTKLRGVCPPN